ncbi:alpha/beta hydrolase [Actinomadura kijaniata]|uniref:Pimeloyl-ACP methyl ester carboxylesterase n=1 Tax=Actinomadura namibiensis TaxID=182080 RepID=A0A7W3LIE8_ACTNM|nr:alpha/beta hydrolase [Actinomadura namibiensis]MBA8948690.1 pimeloyl-ACP methyl ester carboxylesterase [Actinomadura namibiensis]
MTSLVFTSDRRALAVEEWGEDAGAPVFLLHGTPGSRLGPIPRPMVLYQLGIRLITFDRPGYGRSERHFGRVVADIAADVRQIADHLGLTEFAVLGRSGGGPHALACAALLPERVRRTAVLVGLAPAQAEGLDWFEGMTASNTREYMAVRHQGRLISARLRSAAERIRADPARLVADLYHELPLSDRRIVGDGGIRRMLAATYTEAFRASADGWVDDLLAFCAPWGFELGGITVPTMLWHGADDTFSPVGHSRWLGANIPSSTVVIESGSAHFGAFDVLPDVLAWLAGPSRDDRASQRL